LNRLEAKSMGVLEAMTSASEYVDLETAKTASGARLVTVGGIPSPWSESVKGLLRLSNVPFVAVRLMPGDKEVREWTRARNAPVLMVDGDPPRTGWAEILELVERIAPAGAKSLVPSAPHDRMRFFGLAHELMGEGGIIWSARLLAVHFGIESDGARGFPTMVAQYLGKKYGYTKDRVEPAKARIREGWTLLAEALGDREYFFFDDRPSALDVYVACALNIFVVPPEDRCAMWPPIRQAFETMRGVVEDPPAPLLALRDRMYERHLPKTIEV
jgi:glutathione S-transferase